MRIGNAFIFFLMWVAAGTVMFPLFSHALLISDNLRKIHNESWEQREALREQFKQDVLEKRKEVLSKWAHRRQEFEEKLSKERDRVRLGFELRRMRNREDKSSRETTETQASGVAARERVLSLVNLLRNYFSTTIMSNQKGAQDIVDSFLLFKNLFEDGEK